MICFFEKTEQSPGHSKACMEFLGKWQCFEKAQGEAHTIWVNPVCFGEDVEAAQEGHLISWWHVSFGKYNEEAEEEAHTMSLKLGLFGETRRKKWRKKHTPSVTRAAVLVKVMKRRGRERTPCSGYVNFLVKPK